MSGVQQPHTRAGTAVSGDGYNNSSQKLPSFLDQLVNKQNLQRQVMQS